MHRGGRRRIFALAWAVLQLALPVFATVADTRLATGSPGRAHVEETTGRDCAPSHSSDCVVCKHLSTSSLGSTHPSAAFDSDGRTGTAARRVAPVPRTLASVALPRAPPTDA